MARKRLENMVAPDFELTDTLGKTIHLSERLKQGPVVLVLNRGFM
jgi:peroxiredoxin